MRISITIKFILIILLSAAVSYGQSVDLENYLNPSEEIEGSSDLYDMIEEFSVYKFDLNESAVEELYLNQLINSNTIRAIQKKRKRGRYFGALMM